MKGPNPMVSGSPETITAADQAHVQITKLATPKDGWGKLLVFFLALNLAAVIACILELKQVATEERLKQYNMDWFRTHEFAQVEGNVALIQKLIDLKVVNCKGDEDGRRNDNHQQK